MFLFFKGKIITRLDLAPGGCQNSVPGGVRIVFPGVSE